MLRTLVQFVTQTYVFSIFQAFSTAEEVKPENNLIVLFGGDGDLARKKLFPALKSLHEQQLSNPVLIVSKSDHDIHGAIDSLGIEDWEDDFLENIYFQKQDLTDSSPKKFENRVEELSQKHACAGNRVFYFAIPYFLFPDAADLIESSGTDTENSVFAFEKPFGADAQSAERILNEVKSLVGGESLYFVDHYLAKEMVDDILSLRFGSKVIGSLWNGRDVDHIQLELSEDFGVKGREQYYESAGAVRDVFQSHLLQVLSLCLMSEPDSLQPQDITSQKAEALEYLNPPSPEDCVFGQYGCPGAEQESYRSLENVSDSSMTETFFAGEFTTDSPLWVETPIYVKTGKKMDRHASHLSLILSKDSDLYEQGSREAVSIFMHPFRGIVCTFDVKSDSGLSRSPMVYRRDFVPGNTPSAYEKIFKNLLARREKMFVSEEVLMDSWRLTQNLMDAKHNQELDFPNYEPGSRGPDRAVDMVPGEGWLDFDDTYLSDFSS